MGWIVALYEIAKGDITKQEEILKMSIYKVLQWLEIGNAKNNEEAKEMERQNLRLKK